MQSWIVVNGTDYDGTASGWAAQGISDIEFSWDLEGHWSLSFNVYRVCNLGLPYPAGSPVALDIDDGSGRRHVFVGDLQRPEGRVGVTGYVWSYSATDLKNRAEYITLSGLDGSGTASFNLSPDDPLSLYATSGQTAGNIVQALLCQVDNATALDAVGIGAYVSMSPPTLPSTTLADLAALAVVPNLPVQLRGESLLNTLEELILFWHPRYCLYVQADGTIRVRSIFSLTSHAVSLPDNSGGGADVDWPGLVVDISGCFTAWQIQGLDIQAATLQTVQGTLSGLGAGTAGSPKSGWTSAQQSAWTISDFTQPKNATDDGALSSVTSSSATVHSDYAAAHWIANYWNQSDVQGWIWFFNLSAAGINIYEIRQITSCTALTAGGTATVTWDSSLPLNSTSYTRYRIVGQATPQSLVSRKFFVREPGSGLTGTDTWVGSHLYPRNSKGMPVANSSRVFNVFYPYCEVWWSRTGAAPWFSVPVPVQIDPLDGSIVLSQPAVQLSAGLAGATSALQNGYPANFQNGLYYNVLAVIPYNRGALSARAPSSGFSGTAYTKYGLQRVKTQKIDTFNWIGDQPALGQLAAEHLATSQDVVVTGTLNFYELPTTFDVFTPGFSLAISTADGATPVDGLTLPVRSATIRWHDSPDPVLYSASLRFNNRRRPFEADSLYIHTPLGTSAFGMQGDGVFGESMMGMSRDVASSMGRQASGNQIGGAVAGFGESPDVGEMGLSRGWSPGRSGDPNHVMGRDDRRPAGPPLPPGYTPPADPQNPRSIMNMPPTLDVAINPDDARSPRIPGGLASQRYDDDESAGGD